MIKAKGLSGDLEGIVSTLYNGKNGEPVYKAPVAIPAEESGKSKRRYIRKKLTVKG